MKEPIPKAGHVFNLLLSSSITHEERVQEGGRGGDSRPRGPLSTLHISCRKTKRLQGPGEERLRKAYLFLKWCNGMGNDLFVDFPAGCWPRY